MRRRAKLSHRDQLRANDAAQTFYSRMSGKPVPEGVLNNVAPAKPRLHKPSNPARVLERDVLKAIMAALKQHPKVARVQRRQSGVFEVDGRIIRVGSRGEADIHVTLYGGKQAEIEVKAPGRYLTAVQKVRLEKSRQMGILAGCAHSVTEAIAIIEGK